MLAKFPVFKRLVLEDRPFVEAHTLRYPPYSDFNFTSLWAWDTYGKRMLSILNDNLVVKFTDYDTGELFLSFLGANDPENTARALIVYCKEHGMEPTLRLMPEVSVQGLRTAEFLIEEDRDNFDYVFSVSALSAMQGGALRGRRQFINRFERDHSRPRLGNLLLSRHEGAQQDIRSVMSLWVRSKEREGKVCDVRNESLAIIRLLESGHAHPLGCIGVYDGPEMLAFSLYEALPNSFAIGHFWKADSSHTGVYDYLMRAIARRLSVLGIDQLNYEQDLGIPGLRKSKMDYRPVEFLRKFRVSIQ